MKPQIEREKWKLLHSIDRLLEGPMVVLAFGWLILMIVEFVWGLARPLQILMYVIWIIFIIDFLVTFTIAPVKSTFLKKNWLTAISLFIPAFRVFRVIRFLRVLRGLRLLRVVSTMNRSMRSLGATMRRRAFGYVVLLSILVTFAGAAGMHAFENPAPGFDNFGEALWWTAMRVITEGGQHFPHTTEGRFLAFLIALYGYAIFGYVTATLATFFIGRDAEEKRTPVAGAADVAELKMEIKSLVSAVKRLEESRFKP